MEEDDEEEVSERAEGFSSPDDEKADEEATGVPGVEDDGEEGVWLMVLMAIRGVAVGVLSERSRGNVDKEEEGEVEETEEVVVWV